MSWVKELLGSQYSQCSMSEMEPLFHRWGLSRREPTACDAFAWDLASAIGAWGQDKTPDVLLHLRGWGTREPCVLATAVWGLAEMGGKKRGWSCFKYHRLSPFRLNLHRFYWIVVHLLFALWDHFQELWIWMFACVYVFYFYKKIILTNFIEEQASRAPHAIRPEVNLL